MGEHPRKGRWVPAGRDGSRRDPAMVGEAPAHPGQAGPGRRARAAGPALPRGRRGEGDNALEREKAFSSPLPGGRGTSGDSGVKPQNVAVYAGTGTGSTGKLGKAERIFLFKKLLFEGTLPFKGTKSSVSQFPAFFPKKTPSFFLKAKANQER